MYITGKHLSRRAVLRGLGVAVTLPLLDAMIPAVASASARRALRGPSGAAPLRFGGVYMPNGVLPERWHPKVTGMAGLDPKTIAGGFVDKGFELTDPLKSLQSLRDHMITVNNLTGSGTPGPHLGCSCGWLNGVGALGPDGQPIKSGKTFDQFLVDKIGQSTPLPSIQIGNEDMGTSVGSCDGYSCVYFSAISWRTDANPLPVQINPRLVFEAMYGATGTKAERLSKMRYRESILDTVGEEANQLYRQVGPADRQLVSAYLENIREVEQRVQRLIDRTETSNTKTPPIPAGIPSSFADHVKLNYDLMHLAFQGDIARVFTYLTAVEASNQGYPWIGVPDSHHVCSHHGGIPEMMDKYTKIFTWHTAQFAAFAQKLKDTPDGDGSLLDHSVLYLATGMGNGNVHDRHPPAAVLVGGANGRLKGGRSVIAKAGTWQCDLLLNLAEMTDVELKRIGPSNGKVAHI